MGILVLIIIQDWKFKFKDRTVWDGMNWGNFNRGDKVFVGSFGLDHGDNHLVFEKEEEGTVFLSYYPTSPDYINELLSHIKCVEF